MEKREEKSETQLHIEQLFQQMLPTEDAPPAVKEEVFNTLDSLHLLGDVMDLFTAKFTQTETEFLDLLSDGDELS